MYRAETLIILKTNKKFKSKWGVECNPVLNNGNYILPLGWEDELTDNKVKFEVKEVEVFKEDII